MNTAVVPPPTAVLAGLFKRQAGSRDTLLFCSFVVILVTVLVQGCSLGSLIRLMKFNDVPVRDGDLIGEAAARAEVTEASLKILEGLVEGDESKLLHPRLVEDYRTRVRLTARLRDDEFGLSKVRKEYFDAALLAVAGGRSHLVRLHRDGKIHDSVLHTIESELDLEELRMRRFSGDERGSHHGN